MPSTGNRLNGRDPLPAGIVRSIRGVDYFYNYDIRGATAWLTPSFKLGRQPFPLVRLHRCHAIAKFLIASGSRSEK
jgi:hypothetical protein